VEDIAQQDEYREKLQKLKAFQRIDRLTPLALICELGDFKKSLGAGVFMSYLGLVPSEFSSGTRRSQGYITKTKNIS
jgi:transposase